MIKNNFEVYTLAKDDEYSKRVELLGCKTVNLKIDLNGKNLLKELITFKDLFIKIKKIKPDLSLIYTIKPNIYASVVCRLLRLNYINFITGLGTVFINNGIITKLIKILYRISLQNSKSIIVQNINDFNMFNNIGVNKKKLKIISGSGVDVNYFNLSNFNDNQNEKKKNKNNGFIFLFIGRLLNEKGIREYIKAANEININNYQAMFYIVGGHDKNNSSAINDNYLKIIQENNYFKYISHTDNIGEIIKLADCIVLPSYREGLSRSLLEAMSMEKPILASDVPGCSELVKDGLNGYTFKHRNAIQLKEKMLKMIHLDKFKLNVMGKRSRELVIDNYSDDIIIKKIYKIILENLI